MTEIVSFVPIRSFETTDDYARRLCLRYSHQQPLPNQPSDRLQSPLSVISQLRTTMPGDCVSTTRASGLICVEVLCKPLPLSKFIFCSKHCSHRLPLLLRMPAHMKNRCNKNHALSFRYFIHQQIWKCIGHRFP